MVTPRVNSKSGVGSPYRVPVQWLLQVYGPAAMTAAANAAAGQHGWTILGLDWHPDAIRMRGRERASSSFGSTRRRGFLEPRRWSSSGASRVPPSRWRSK